MKVVIALSFLLAGIAVAGGVTGDELLLGFGVACAFICLLIIPVSQLREKKAEKLKAREDALAVWQYSPQETEIIAREQRHVVFKKARSISILLSVCLAIIALPFIVISAQPDSELPPMLPYAATAVLLPWISLITAPMLAENRIRRMPCVSVIGRDYLIITNRRPGINDRWQLKAEEAKLEPGKDGGLSTLRVRYSFRAGRTTRTFRLWMDVPVPRGMESRAERIRF